jgi:hypothetical protein
VTAIAAVGLLVGAGLGATGSTNSAKTTTSTVAGPTQTVITPGQVVVHNRVRTVTVTRQAAAPAAPTPSSGGGGAGQQFSGTGTQNLGTITVGQDSTLRWTDEGGGVAHSILISSDLTDSGNTIDVSSNSATSGQSQVTAGTYKNVQVIGDDAWTISISPG